MSHPLIQPRAAGRDPAAVGSALVGSITRMSPMHVTIGGREYGPLVVTRAAAATGLAVGSRVVLVRQEDDPDRLIVIDGVA